MPTTKKVRRKALPYRDCSTHSANNGTYLTTNESTTTFERLLGDTEVDRAAGICSGGEIGLLVLLPRVKKELVLVDHHYTTMSYAMMKWLIIQEVGGKEAHRLLTCPNKEMVALVKKLTKRLPQNMRGHFTFKETRTYDYNTHSYRKNQGEFNPFCSSDGAKHVIQRKWGLFTPEQVEAVENKLNLVKFLHGDIVADLKRRKPFDLLYLSNAMDYMGRSGKPTFDRIEPLVRPGGLILTTGHHAGSVETVKERTLVSNDRLTGWNHNLTRVPEAQVVPA